MSNYTVESIDFLKGLETIRMRSDMYIGQTTGSPSSGLYRLCREAIDNSLDEYLGGFNNKLYIFYNSKTYETIVVDNGRGIPVGWHSKAKQDSLTLVFTQLHAGGKFNHDSYKTSSGKNGIGQKAISALSSHLQVWSNNSKGKKWFSQIFSEGRVKSEVLQNNPPDELLKLIPKTGTVIKWTPDKKIFKDSLKLDIERLKRELDDIQYLCPKLKMHLFIDDKEEVFYSELGLGELVSKNPLHDIIFEFSDEFTDIALNFTKLEGHSLKSFVNISHTNLGGTHLKGLRKGLLDVIKSKSKIRLANEDVLEGVFGAIHHKMAEPQYQGQTKNELTNSGVENEIINKLTPELEKFFRKNKDLLSRIVEYSEKMALQREKIKTSKNILRGINKLSNKANRISDKFLDADRRKHKNRMDLEMFIVEGDSAGGHFKQARESFQGELKIRGKIINSAKASIEDLFGKNGKGGNREVQDLVSALGCGIGDEYDEKKLRFGKVIILSDADVDGQHITNLCLSFFINYMPDLIKNGHVYIVDAPLFIASSSKERVFGMTRNEVEGKMKKLKIKDYTITRLKGWGETSSEQLSELCLNKKTRKLIQIKWNNKTEEMCRKTMGDDVEFRKELLGIE